MFIKRAISDRLGAYAKFPVVAILGPRQSGKTTLAQAYFKNHTFFNLEHTTTIELIRKDPEAFFRTHENDHGIILDEFQNEPGLLSYIQVIADQKDRPGYFVLTGSQNFLMNQAITQSLAGRVAILTLMPLSVQELAQANLLKNYDDHIISGFYPRMYAQDVERFLLYASYIQTYIERDVRQVVAEQDLMTFQLFLKLCAGRVGQQLNKVEMATQCGVDVKVITRWLSHLQASYIIFLLPPYYKNYNKRLTKAPKLYFYDTGIATFLLSINTPKELLVSPFRGALFENLVIADLAKQYYQMGGLPQLYYWRDLNGRLEVDCIIDRVASIVPIEIKASETFNPRFFDSIDQLSALAGTQAQAGYVVYAGVLGQKMADGTLVSWNKSGDLVKGIIGTPGQN